MGLGFVHKFITQFFQVTGFPNLLAVPLSLSRLTCMEVLVFQHCTLLSFYLVSPCTLEKNWHQRALQHEGISLCRHSSLHNSSKRAAVSRVWPGGGRFPEIMTRIGFLERSDFQGRSSWPVIHSAFTKTKPPRKCWILTLFLTKWLTFTLSFLLLINVWGGFILVLRCSELFPQS